MDDAIVTALTITDEQKDDLNDALADQQQAMMDAFQDFRDMSAEERTEALAELNQERDEALLAVLNDEQKSQFDAMKGEKIDIDMSQLRRGFGGRGGFGGGGGGGFGGGGGGGNRPADDGGAADEAHNHCPAPRVRSVILAVLESGQRRFSPLFLIASSTQTWEDR